MSNNLFKLDSKYLIGMILVAILILVFFEKSQVDKKQYYTTISKLNDIKQSNSRLYDKIILIKTNNIKDFKPLEQELENIFSHSNFLDNYITKLDDSLLIQQWKQYQESVKKLKTSLDILIEDIKTYKFYKKEYPSLTSYMIKQYDTYSNEKLSVEILKLQNLILIPSLYDEKKVFEQISHIKGFFNSTTIEEEKSLIELIDKTEKIIETSKQVEISEKNFNKLNLDLQLELLINRYQDYFHTLENSSAKYLIFMMLLSLFLLIWILYFITNLKQANNKIEETIHELNFQKSALDEHAIVSITDNKGNITYINEKFEKISGYSANELIGKNHRLLKSDEHDKEFFKEMWKTISSGKTWQGEVKNKSRDGSFYWVNATIVPFMDDNNKPFQYISIRTDITNRKLIEEQLVEAKVKAIESDKIKTEFLANMSHELRTPLNGVIGMANIALENEKEKKQREYLEKINSSANILLKLINDLLDYSKIEAGKLDIENIEFDIDDLLQNVADLISVKAYEKDLELIFDRDLDIPKKLIGDSLRISQILVNLLGNAIKFTSKGEISLNIKLNEKDEEKVKLVLEIKDSGIGMDENSLKNIFNSFTQADNSITRKFGGTGLGLTITKNLVELMNGEITVESEVGVGTTFILEFTFDYIEDEKNIDYSLTKDLIVYIYDVTKPIKKTLKNILNSLKIECIFIDSLDIDFNNKKRILITENKNSFESKNNFSILYISNPNNFITIKDENIKLITKPINPSIIYDSILEIMNLNEEIMNSLHIKKSRNCENVNVLLVEDNEINQLVATTFLEGFGCNIKIANNGQEAVDMIKNQAENFDIIFMDIQMPIMNGYEATKIIKTELNPNIPIIAMTANAMKDDIKRCLDAGMNKHIGKPVDKNEIEKAILTFVKR